MAPRGRQRPRNTRMDAAIDAMGRLGFEEAFVRLKVKELLKVYGGDDNWLFIEEDGYRELIEFLIEAETEKGEDNDEEKGGQGRLLQNSSQDQEPPAASVYTTSNAIAYSEPIGSDIVPSVSESARPEVMVDVAPPESCSPTLINMDCDPRPPAQGNGNSWKDIRLDQSSEEKETAISVSNTDGFAQTNNLPGQTSAISPSSTKATCVQPANDHAIRRPCYGWLDCDEEELEFVYLTPAARRTTPSVPSEHSDGKTNGRIRRKSRWDLKPEDN